MMSTASIAQCTGRVRRGGEKPARAWGGANGLGGSDVMIGPFGGAGGDPRGGFEVVVRPEVDEFGRGEVVEEGYAAPRAAAGGQHPGRGQREADHDVVGRLRATEGCWTSCCRAGHV